MYTQILKTFSFFCNILTILDTNQKNFFEYYSKFYSLQYKIILKRIIFIYAKLSKFSLA
jgi:hypothetical protein